MTAVRLGEGSEFDLIRELAGRWGALAVGLGDDAAMIEVPRGERLLASTDASVEGVHFRADWLSHREIGYRAATAALSDLAAMGARPLGLLVALELPAPARARVPELADGIGDAASAAGTVIRGGNVTAAGALGLTLTALGCAFDPLRRDAARPGDLVYVTGELGGPGAALRHLLGGQAPPHAARARFARPVARLREAAWLAARGASACIDISDGLAGDALHMASASAVAIEIDVDRIPALGGATEQDLFGGEEYELLLASRVPLPENAFRDAFDARLTLIGRVAEGPADVRFKKGDRRVAVPRSYDHFPPP